MRDSTRTPHPDPVVLWDSIPAFGVLGGVGGTPLPSPFRILLMDCTDLNNFIETLHQLDIGYRGEAQVFVQTPNGQALARNLILCFLLLRMASGELDDSAADAVIAIWYSVDLTPSQYLLLMDTIVQLLNTTPNTLPCRSFPPPPSIFQPDRHILDIQADMVNLTRKYGNEDLLSGTMKQLQCSGSSLSVRMHGLVLYKYLTQMGLSSLDPEAASREWALERYGRQNGMDGFLLEPHYSALEKFGELGLLLPFAAQSSHHCLPNPTLVSAIDNPRVGWSAVTGRLEPLCGWPVHQVTSNDFQGRRHHGVPQNDLYGSLYFYIRDRILSAVAKIRACEIAFHFSDHQSRVQYCNDLITKGPGTRSVHIARVVLCTDERLGQSSKVAAKKLFSRRVLHPVLVDGGVVIMLVNDGYGFSEKDLKAAGLQFANFISKLKTNPFAERLIRTGQLDMGRTKIVELFLPYDASMKELMKEFQNIHYWEFPSVPSSSIYLPFMIYRRPAKMLNKKKASRKAKAAEKVAVLKQVRQGMPSNIGTPQECYMEVMLTTFMHSEMILEFRKKA